MHHHSPILSFECLSLKVELRFFRWISHDFLLCFSVWLVHANNYEVAEDVEPQAKESHANQSLEEQGEIREEIGEETCSGYQVPWTGKY